MTPDSPGRLRGRGARRLRATVLVVAAVSCLSADGDPREPVLGGGSFNEPLPLAVGGYRDVIGFDESLFYVLDGPAGATWELTVSAGASDVASGLEVGAYDASRRTLVEPSTVIVDADEDVMATLRVPTVTEPADAPVTVVATRFTDAPDDDVALTLDVEVDVAAPVALDDAGRPGPVARRPATPSADGVTASTADLAARPAVEEVATGVLLGTLVGVLGWRWRRVLATGVAWLDARTRDDPSPRGA